MKGVCIRSTEYRVVESRVRRECGWKRPTQKGRKRLCWTTPILCIILDLFYKLLSVASLFIYFALLSEAHPFAFCHIIRLFPLCLLRLFLLSFLGPHSFATLTYITRTYITLSIDQILCLPGSLAVCNSRWLVLGS